MSFHQLPLHCEHANREGLDLGELTIRFICPA
jgi:hypothetical protein